MVRGLASANGEGQRKSCMRRHKVTENEDCQGIRTSFVGRGRKWAGELSRGQVTEHQIKETGLRVPYSSS